MERKKKWILTPGKKLALAYLPIFALVFVFSYLPMWGTVMSFYDYKLGWKLSDCDFVGFKHYVSAFENPIMRREVLRVIKNTLQYFLLSIIFSPLTMMFAIFLNEIKNSKLKRVIQTVTTMPNFISWVSIYAIAFMLLAPETGVVNILLKEWGVIEEGINFLGDPSNIKLKLQFWAIWKGLGWGAIIYLSGISGIDQQLYEAASIDGAGRFKKMWHITVPGIMPVYVTSMILTLGSAINQGMDQQYVFENAFNKSAIEMLDLYLYHIGIGGDKISFSIAIGQMKAIIGLGLMFYANFLSKKIRGVDVI